MSLEQDKDYALFSWDDVATVMTEQGKESIQDVDLHDVEDIGNVTIYSTKFIDIDIM